MNHRHLLPDEIDLLLDDEVGFGVAPLKAHIRDCADCRAQVDEARFVVDALEDLPHFAPSHTFADRVMSQVPVFVPWHVAARDTVRRWLPTVAPGSRGRRGAGHVGGVAADGRDPVDRHPGRRGRAGVRRRRGVESQRLVFECRPSDPDDRLR